MNVKVLKNEANELKIEIEGADHGICNLLQKKLLEDAKVDLAGYDVPHPLASSPIIYVRMKGKAKPDEALLKAADNARGMNSELSKELKKALKS